MGTDLGRVSEGASAVADRVLSPSATEPEVSAHTGNAPLRDALASFAPDVVAVLDALSDGEQCDSAAYLSTEIGVREARIKEIRRALCCLGFAEFGPLCDISSERYATRGSGYWITASGERLRRGIASAIEARRAATVEQGAVHESAVGAAETPDFHGGIA